MNQPIDLLIAPVATKQQGNVTRAQLLRVGLDDAAIARRVASGRMFREHPGVYSVGHPATTPLERASAAVLACGEGAVLSHGSAMTHWGFWKRWDRPFEVTVPGNRRPRGIHVHRSRTLRRPDVVTHLGIRVTSPARTIFDMASRWNDQTLRRNLNNALHSPYLTEPPLEELLGRHPHHLTTKRIVPLLGLGGTPTRSGWEDGFPAFCRCYGLPDPTMGAMVCGYIVDALFPHERVIVELDSWEFHRTKIDFENDRERDAETLAHGFVTVRATWNRIQRRPRPEAERLHTILAIRRAQAA